MGTRGIQRIRITRFEQAPLGGHWLAFASTDEAAFYDLVALVKTLGAAYASWDADERAWWIAPVGLARLLAMAPALRDLLVQQQENRDRASSRAGAKSQTGEGRSRRASTTEAPTDAPPRVPADVARALATLYITPDAPLCVVKAAYRALSKTAHPDAGGDHERMKAINLAWEAASGWAKAHGARIGA